jgi:hypothetical protein
MALRSDAYVFDKMRRRVLAGLTPEETFEFELLDAQLPFDGKPMILCAGLSLSQVQQRWPQLFEKMESVRRLGVVSHSMTPSKSNASPGQNALDSQRLRTDAGSVGSSASGPPLGTAEIEG